MERLLSSIMVSCRNGLSNQSLPGVLGLDSSMVAGYQGSRAREKIDPVAYRVCNAKGGTALVDSFVGSI